MALKGKIYSIAKQHDDLNTNELFQSMIDKSAAQDTIVMDGRNIAAGSVFAEQIHAGAITADKIRADAITADHMNVGSLSAISTNIGEITTGIIRSRDNSIDINLNTGIIDLSKPLTINSKAVATSEQVTQAVDGVDGKVDALSTRMSNAEVKIEPSAIVTTVTGHTTFKNVKEKAESAKSTLDSKSSTWDAKATTGYVDGKAGTAETNAKNYAKQQVDDIEVGGRNLFSVNQYVSLRNSERTANGDRYSVGSSGALVVDGVDGSGGYDTMRMVDLKADTEYIFTFNIPINDRFTFYDTDGVAISVAREWNSDNTQLTFKMGDVDGYIGGKFYPIEQSYPMEIYIMAEKGNKATDWTPAPEDTQLESDKKTYLPVRYIRDWQNGSTSNDGNHWYQIEAYVNGENVARGKPVTGASLTNGTRATDGVRGGSYASGPRGSLSDVTVDLGKTYYNVDSVGVWHYYSDGRAYKETMTEVSPDGTNWYPIFDSAVEGEYKTSAEGRVFPNTWARYEAVKTPIRLTERVTTAEQKITDDAIRSTVTSSTTFKDIQSKANSAKETLDSKSSAWDSKATTGYVDSKSSTAETNAKTHADGKASTAEANAKKYANENIKTWESNYRVNTANPLPLTRIDGSNLDDMYSYEIHAKVTGTGTITSAHAVFKANNSGGTGGKGWTLVMIDEYGTGSNHPEIFMNSGVPSIRLYGHSSYYNVAITHYESIGMGSTAVQARDAKGVADEAKTTADTLKNTTVPQLTSRVNTAEQKITDTAIRNTVTSHSTFKTVQENASSAKSTLDSKSSAWDAKATTGYVDGKASTAETNAKTHADGKASTAEANAKTHADNVAKAKADLAILDSYLQSGRSIQNISDDLTHMRFNRGYIQFPDTVKELIQGKQSATVEFWVKKYDRDYGLMQLSGFANGNGTIYPYGTSGNGNQVYLDTFRTNRIGATNLKYDVLEWHHFAVTTHPTHGWKLYQNGELIRTVDGQSVVDVSYLDFRIGQNSNNRWAKASFRDIRLWDKYRTQEDISRDMGRLLYGDEDGLVGYWRLDEGQGNIAKDIVNGNDGTITSGVWGGNRSEIQETKAEQAVISERVRTAEQKITDKAIVSTVTESSTYKNEMTGKVSVNEVISRINQTAEKITIDAKRININGAVTFSSFGTDVTNKLDDIESDASTAKSTASSAQSTASTAKSTADTANKAASEAKSTAASASSTASTAKTTADNASSTASTAKATADTANTAASNAMTRVTIHDTRNNNQPPSWYFSNYARQIVQEFKLTSTMGIGTSLETYGILLTTVPWSGTSGGSIKQEFKVRDRMYTRDGTSSSWTAWKDALGEAEAAKTSASNAQSTANTAKSTLDSKAPIWDAKETTSGAQAKAEAAVDALEVGGRNLALNTEGKLRRTFGSGANLTHTTGATRFTWTGTSQTSMGESISIPLIQNETYTLSFQARGNTDTLEIFILTSSGGNLSISSSLDSRSVSSSFRKYSATFSYNTPNPSKDIFVGARGPSGRWLEVKDQTLKLEKGSKATDWSPAPEDQNRKTYNPVRYIRDWSGGSNRNTGNHKYELQAYANGENIARGKTVTGNGPTNSNLQIFTNGSTSTGTYLNLGNSSTPVYAQVDLGEIYYNVDSIAIWRYYDDNRTYYKTKIEVSADGTNWVPVFDSLVEGEYAESAAGRTYPNTQAKSESLIASQEMVNRLGDSTSRTIIDGGNITTGRIQSKNNYSWLSLENGQFNLANGGLIYNSSGLTVNGKLSVTNLNGKLTDSQISSAATWNAKETTGGAQAKATAAETAAKNHANKVSRLTVLDSSNKKFSNLAGLQNKTSSVTGYLIIRTPITTPYMTKVKISGYNYLTNNTNIDLTVGFYAYTNSFLQHSFMSSGDFPIEDVHLARDSSGRAVIIVGKSNTKWSYPSINIDEAQIGYSNPPDSYLDGWSIEFSTSITAYASQRVKINGGDVNLRIDSADNKADNANKRVGDVEGKINNAVTTIDNTGVTVKDGSFFLVDDTTDTKYSVPTKENLIKNHSFELINRDSRSGKLHIPPGGEWDFIQEDPYELLPGAGFIIEGSRAVQIDGGFHVPMNFFGNYSMRVNNKNYLKTELAVRENGYYTISAYFRKTPYSDSDVQPRFKLYEEDGRGGSRDIGTFTFDKIERHGEIKRYSTTFYAKATVPTGTYDPDTGAPFYTYSWTYLEIMSANSAFVQVDGVQLVEGDTPVVYDAEVNHWDFINGGSSVKQLSTRDIVVGGIDGRIKFDNSRVGTSEISTGDSLSTYTGLNIRGNSGINLLSESGATNVHGSFNQSSDGTGVVNFTDRINTSRTGDAFRINSNRPNGHGFYSWYGSDNKRKAYLGFGSTSTNIFHISNESGGQVNVKGELSVDKDVFVNVDKKVPSIMRSSVSIGPNVWATIDLPSRGLYLLAVGLGTNPGAYIVGNWNTGVVWSHLGGHTANIERLGDAKLRIRMGGYYQYGLVHLN